jgi:hypothetical protein
MTAALFIFALLFIPLCTGTAALLVSASKKAPRPPYGLLLHTLSEKTHPHCSYYSPARFEELLRILKEKKNAFVTVTEASRMVPTGSDGSAVVVTFDDGFESFYSRALPLLKKYGYRVTVFPVAGFLGRSSTWDTLPPQTHMTPEQLREIAGLGHEIGSHTMSHANLTLLSDRDLRDELSRSKAVLEDVIGKAVTSLSFPFGQWNLRVWDAAREAGYVAATSYAFRARGVPGIVPLWGVYSFDSVDDIIERAINGAPFSNALARGRVMPHFAKGTPMWKFRKNYAVLR